MGYPFFQTENLQFEGYLSICGLLVRSRQPGLQRNIEMLSVICPLGENLAKGRHEARMCTEAVTPRQRMMELGTEGAYRELG